jgi:hypothetical protein
MSSLFIRDSSNPAVAKQRHHKTKYYFFGSHKFAQPFSQKQKSHFRVVYWLGIGHFRLE